MGRILGIDFGLRRVGAALSDVERRMASPLEVFERRDPHAEARHYRELVAEERIDRIVVGLPVHGHGGESAISTQARAWGAWLATTCGVPVIFFDERFTSREADERMREAGIKASARKGRIDMVAAQILLQDYLDAGCPDVETPSQPLDDPR